MQFLVFNYLQLSLFVRVAKPKTKLFTSMTKAILVELEFADDMIMVFTKVIIIARLA